MPYLDHVAIWTKNLEQLKEFYQTYFQARPGEKYTNPAKQYESYFLVFDSGARLELMRMPSIPDSTNNVFTQFTGIVHLAVAVGSEAAVDALTERLRRDGHRIVGEPRHTGDGYYESVALDPDGNRLEITV